ncbi:hypothetical protein OC845_000648 [Tilletia horrida]|nr:hypothetical protein OC845_000648 [Tilletia horrida]
MADSQQAIFTNMAPSLLLTTAAAESAKAGGSKRPAFIGIVIAITANIIISIALNVQKMAHIRLQQQSYQQQQDQYEDDEEYDDEDEEEEEEEGDDYHNRTAVDTIPEESESAPASVRNSQHLSPHQAHSAESDSSPPSPSPAPRNSSSQRQTPPALSGSSTEADSTIAPSSPPSRSKSKSLLLEDTDLESREGDRQGVYENGERDHDADESQPLLSNDDAFPHGTRRSSASGGGNGNNGGAGGTKFLRSRLWWCGIGLMTLGEAGNFISYGFAPASLVAPLGAVALLSNVIIAPLLLHERFRVRDLGGIVLAIVGAVTVVYSSRQDDPALGHDELWAAIRRSVFLIYMAVVLSCGAVLAAVSLTKLGDRFVLLDVGTCAIFGGFTVLSTKGISSMLSAGPSPFDLFRYPITYALAFVLASTAVLQITFLNRALQRFDSRQVIPTMFTLFTIMAIVGSAVLYRDFEDMDAHRLINFLFGCATTFGGVFLLTRRHEDDEDQSGKGHAEHHGQTEQERVTGLEDVEEVEEEEEEGHTGSGGQSGIRGAGASPHIFEDQSHLIQEPDPLSIPASATSATAPGTVVELVRPVPEHSQSSPIPLASSAGIPAQPIPFGQSPASNAAGRRPHRSITALDGTGTAFLAAGSPPGMVFALGGAGVRERTSGSSPGHEAALPSANVVAAIPAGGSTPAGMKGLSVQQQANLSTVSLPVTPIRHPHTAAQAGNTGVLIPVAVASGSNLANTPSGGPGILPLYRTNRLSLVGSANMIPAGSSSSGVVPVSIAGPTPSASISALSAGQLLLLATPRPNPIPMPSAAVPIPSSTNTSGRGGHDGNLARSLPTDGSRSRTLSAPGTSSAAGLAGSGPGGPRRLRSRKGLRADATAQAQGSGSKERTRSKSGTREADQQQLGGLPSQNYARGQGSWAERRRPGSAVLMGHTTGANQHGGGGGASETLPQRRSVISLFGAWSGSGSGAPGGSAQDSTNGTSSASAAAANASSEDTAPSVTDGATADTRTQDR